MVDMVNYLKKRYLTEKAQGVVEYALVIAFVVVAAAVLSKGGGDLGTKINTIFTNLSKMFS